MVDADGKLEARTVCSMKYTFDERIEDGLYCAQSLELLRKWSKTPPSTSPAPSSAPPESRGSLVPSQMKERTSAMAPSDKKTTTETETSRPAALPARWCRCRTPESASA